METINIERTNEVIYHHKLDCGLNIYVWECSEVSDINLTLTVKYGSLYTNFEVNKKNIKVPNGIAHFLEHIKFNEEDGKAAHDYFYKMGSYVNAYTTFDHTCYEVTTNDNLKDNINHLLYFVNNNYFTKELINKEKPIIIEEAKMTKNNPFNEGYFELLNNIYKYDNHKYLVTGDEDDIKSITIDDVKNVFDAFYQAENMFLVVTGNVNHYEVVKLCEDFYENYDKKYLNPKIISVKEPKKINIPYSVINTNVSKENIYYGIKIDKKNYKDYNRFELNMYMNILLRNNFSSTSEFHEHIYNNHLVDDFSFTFTQNDDYALILFEAVTSYAKKLIELLESKLNSLEVDENDFNRKKKVYIANTIVDFENAYLVNNEIRASILKYNKILNDTPSLIENLTFDKFTKVKDYLGNEKSYVILKPIKKEE